MNYLEKFQAIVTRMQARGFDKYVLGPFLIWYGMRSKKMPRKARRMLVGAGVFQVFYSWDSYLKIQKQMSDYAKGKISDS